MERLELELASGGARFKNAKRLRNTLEDPEKLLKRIGRVILASSTRAFSEQRFGQFVWKSRYPNQSQPKVNIAGALVLLNAGKKLPGAGHSIFRDRPALIGHTNGLARSLSVKNPDAMKMVGKFTVEVGSSLPYAGNMQFGIPNRIPVTATARKTLAKWMRDARDARKKEASYDKPSHSWVKKGTATPTRVKKKRGPRLKTGRMGTPDWKSGVRRKGTKAKNTGSEPQALGEKKQKQFSARNNVVLALQKLGFLFRVSPLVTDPVARPFIGITRETAAAIREMVEKAIGDQQAADAARQQGFRGQAPKRT